MVIFSLRKIEKCVFIFVDRVFSGKLGVFFFLREKDIWMWEKVVIFDMVVLV